jgi:hypothetical protein
MQPWWRSELEKDLSQGDVVLSLPFSTVAVPPLPLTKAGTAKGGGQQWAHAKSTVLPTSGQGYKAPLISEGLSMPGIVVSHSCDLDKPDAKYVLVAPLVPMATIQSEHQGAVRTGSNVSKMFIPGCDELGEGCLDFRLILPLPLTFVRGSKRVASMSDEARELLWARLVAFFTYRNMPPENKNPV